MSRRLYVRRVRVFPAIVIAMVAVMGVAISAARAQGSGQAPEYGWREFWAGADISANTWLLYTGMTVAPWSDVYSDGFRLRSASGYGQYTYTGVRREGGAFRTREFKSNISYAEALVGYLKRLGPLTAKGFVGYAIVTHDPEQADVEVLETGELAISDAARGAEHGVKGTVELWLNVGDNAWSSLDVSYTTAHETGSARWRGGFRVLPTFSLGIEAIYNLQAESENVRAGAFARYEWFGGEISVSGGVARDLYDYGQTQDNPYGNVNLVIQY